MKLKEKLSKYPKLRKIIELYEILNQDILELYGGEDIIYHASEYIYLTKENDGVFKITGVKNDTFIKVLFKADLKEDIIEHIESTHDIKYIGLYDLENDILTSDYNCPDVFEKYYGFVEDFERANYIIKDLIDDKLNLKEKELIYHKKIIYNANDLRPLFMFDFIETFNNDKMYGLLYDINEGTFVMGYRVFLTELKFREKSTASFEYNLNEVIDKINKIF